jgi:hypothetical protein
MTSVKAVQSLRLEFQEFPDELLRIRVRAETVGATMLDKSKMEVVS